MSWLNSPDPMDVIIDITDHMSNDEAVEYLEDLLEDINTLINKIEEEE